MTSGEVSTRSGTRWRSPWQTRCSDGPRPRRAVTRGEMPRTAAAVMAEELDWSSDDTEQQISAVESTLRVAE